MKSLIAPLRRRASHWRQAARIRAGQPPARIVTVYQAPAATSPSSPFPSAQHMAALPEAPAFNGDLAFAWLEAQCRCGPRVPDSEGHSRARDLLLNELRCRADEVALQEWRQRIDYGPGSGTCPPMTNIFALFRGHADVYTPTAKLRPALMLCAHWDSRPVADNDPDEARRSQPVPGANDGASGTAVLLEMARLLHCSRPAETVVLAFWDGEDLGEYFYGSRLFAAHCRRRALRRWRPQGAILLDMIGGHDLLCTRELNSLRKAPGLWAEVLSAAAAVGLEERFLGPISSINDDHVFLNQAGIPSIVLIDYSYPFWHTTADTVDKCGARSLQIIGDVLVQFLWRRGGGD